MIDDLEPRPVLTARKLEIVDGRDVDQQVEFERGIVTAEGQEIEERLAAHHGGVVSAEVVRLQHTGAGSLAQPRKNRLSVHGDSPLSPTRPLPRRQKRRAPAAILSWSFIRPSMTLSGRGGQPGM